MKKIFIVFSFLVSFTVYSQNSVEVSLQQDFRLLFLGDDKGNEPLTTNLLSKLEVPVYNFKKSYLLTYLSVEYADLKVKNYKRYSIGGGYGISNVCGKIGAIISTDFGKIYREKEGFFSFSVSGELNYKISKRIKITCTQQLTHRKDLVELYNCENPLIISGFVGLKYSL
ncbi:hypothetical protein [Polaribacter sp.]|uniref:hypothetical protein n=1 Tax=Polaribacter sp. TaxID=1920175 RepID=UPI003F6C3F27